MATSGLMNKLFRFGVWHDKAWSKFQTKGLLSNTGAQATMYKDLVKQEQARAVLF